MNIYRCSIFSSLILTLSLLSFLSFAECNPQFGQVNNNGFGSPNNLYTWSLQPFKGYLFASTYNPVDSGEIWRYDGNSWTQVADDGFGNLNNQGMRTLLDFGGYLYAGTLNEVDGAELWRSVDGVTWEPLVVGGFGDIRNISIRGMLQFQDYIYVGLQSQQGDGAEIWRSLDGQNWQQVYSDSPDNDSAHSFAIFKGQLYAGIRNSSQGFSLVRSTDGVNFEFVVGGDSNTPAGLTSSNNLTPYDLHTFSFTSPLTGLPDERLFIGVGNWVTGAAVYRTADGVNFTAVTTDGFGNRSNKFAWRFHSFRGDLWLGLSNADILKDGANVWRAVNGLNWQQMVGNDGLYAPAGFGNQTNWGVRSFATYDKKLYLGTAQCWADACIPANVGTQVWEWRCATTN